MWLVRRLIVCAIVAASLFETSSAEPADYDNSPTIGPAKGWLVIDGGGVPQEVRQDFVRLAGGPNAKFVYIPTARGDEQIDVAKTRLQFSSSFGVTHVTVLHTRDRARANSDGFVEPLRQASAVWIAGGRQWRLADAYLGTAVEREIKALLARGGVVGGSSAGATIQGSYLVRGQSSTPENADGDNRIMMAPGHEIGFALLANSAIDQHINVRHREADLDSVIERFPSLLGIGIDQGAAIIVHGDVFKVVGAQVAIHDGKEHESAHYYFLSPGQIFNLKTRTIESSSTQLAETSISTSPTASTMESTTGSDYPLTLYVTRAQRFYENGSLKTNIMGSLSDEPQQQFHMVCDVGIFSIGPDGKVNRYPARRSKSHQIKIGTREMGKDKVHEHTCKY